MSFDQFSYKLNNVHLKWSTYPSLNKFKDYFFKEWCYHNNEWSRFSCWQLFQTPAGIATTNNPIESFNKTIKSVYTMYEITTVYSFLLTIMQKLINQYSYQSKEFKFYREPTFDQIKLANEIADDEFSYTLVGNNCFSYQAQGKGYLLRIGDSIHYNGYKTVNCSCINYNEKFVCKHSIGLAIKHNLKLKGFELKTTLPANKSRGTTQSNASFR